MLYAYWAVVKSKNRDIFCSTYFERRHKIPKIEDEARGVPKLFLLTQIVGFVIVVVVVVAEGAEAALDADGASPQERVVHPPVLHGRKHVIAGVVIS